MNDRVIDCFVLFIYLFDDCIVVNDNCQEGGRPVSLEDVLGSFFLVCHPLRGGFARCLAGKSLKTFHWNIPLVLPPLNVIFFLVRKGISDIETLKESYGRMGKSLARFT